jgi:hypothetical protein
VFAGDSDFSRPSVVTGILESGRRVEIPVIWDMSGFQGTYGNTYKLQGSLARPVDLEIMASFPRLEVQVKYIREGDVLLPGGMVYTPGEVILGDIRLEFFANRSTFIFTDYSGIAQNLTMDVDALLNDRGDRMLIPVRFFAETLGYEVYFQQRTDTITIVREKDGTSRPGSIDGAERVSLQIGSRVMLVDGRTVVMDTAVEEHNWRTYLPLRYVGEAFGFDVEWDEWNQRAILRGKIVRTRE